MNQSFYFCLLNQVHEGCSRVHFLSTVSRFLYQRVPSSPIDRSLKKQVLYLQVAQVARGVGPGIQFCLNGSLSSQGGELVC